MAKITAAQVKELRDKTSVGMMDAKKALVAADGNMQEAIDKLREKGIAKAAKKSGNIAAEGLAHIEISGNKAAIIEVNSETDFVSSNDKFINLVNEIGKVIVTNEPKDMDEALALKIGDQTVNDAITGLTAVIGEKISLRRFQVLDKTDSQVFGSYLHNGGLIGAIVTLEGKDEDAAKDVAMHVAAINPEYMDRDQVPADRLEHEKAIFTEETKAEGKPEKIIPRIVEGRVNKYLSEISLADQEFVKDSDMTVQQFVESKNSKLVSFVRYEVGEGIEKKQEDFAEEVKNQMK
ncbi:translation elongation factor Ts [Companilactobacillus alimentarius]|uniref:Elongation factor Ts n=1 Tax=Companilactobacillus alimentarius DSM 20249 TaxID=1423720 RepID=A0A2K9HFP9_9LACO|nr:translation elongation factor Ts [Companilactobacillus alimentarius]AUI71379.1 translation elongation factor Ts [Companilactobacillus alimentarius DSM 20249]KRK74722.1 elongation factor Ts [Companilactobacillus alimentarius DSM 20249]MDT6951298.1 translation elongation factor Ts [Companilactobacillus alimentarius]GEO44365.1 elongation factor Ts [Companilactobacillus alimentarius]